jgi:deoxyribodipyrimidine photo-lyase
LKDLPNEYIHAPWKTPSSMLEKIGIEFGKEYPKPIVDHSEAIVRATKYHDEVNKPKKLLKIDSGKNYSK